MPPAVQMQPVYRFHTIFLKGPNDDLLTSILPALWDKVNPGAPPPVPVADLAGLPYRDVLEEAAKVLSECSARGQLGILLTVPGAIIFGEITGYVGIQVEQTIVPAGGPMPKGSGR